MGLGFLGFWVLGDHFSHRERFFSAKSDPFTASRKIVANAQKQLLRRSFTVLCVFVFFDFWPNFGPKSTRTCPYRWRPYRNEYTGSLQNSEVNRCRARIVLRWGTAREVLRVLPALFALWKPVSSPQPRLASAKPDVSTVAILAQGKHSRPALGGPFTSGSF